LPTKTEAYRYDSAGNLIEASDRKGRVTSLSYDEQNRLTRIDYADGTRQGRSYDLLGRLVRIEEGGFLEEYERSRASSPAVFRLQREAWLGLVVRDLDTC